MTVGSGVRPALEAGVLHGVQVMVVDDDHDACDLLQTVLEYCGAHVLSADSARGALATFERIRPDIIVCDLVMPGDDGYTLIRALRTRAAVRTVPVIALTAFSAAHAAEDALAAGFSAYLTKPVEPWELCRTIDRLRSAPRPAAD